MQQHHTSTQRDLFQPDMTDRYIVVDSTSGAPRWVGLTTPALERIAREMETMRQARIARQNGERAQ